MNTAAELFSAVLPTLTAPGEGVFTVHTGAARRADLQQRLFGTTDATAVKQAWHTGIAEQLPTAHTALLGICSDCGGGIQRGANWGPLFLRSHLLAGAPADSPYGPGIFDLGDVRVVPHLLHDKYLNDATVAACRHALYGNAEAALPVAPLSIAHEVCRRFHAAFPDKNLFMFGGDHSVSWSTVSAWAEAKRAQGVNAALIHFDAHTDLLETRLGIDLCFGTWTTHVIPYLPSANHLVQFGIRASGKERGHWEGKFGHSQIWAEEIIKRGAEAVAADAVAKLKALGVEEIYISYDIDCLDQAYAAATGTPETGGISVADSLAIIHAMTQAFRLTGADMVEVAPMVRAPGITHAEPETTLDSACTLTRAMLAAMAAATVTSTGAGA